MTGATLKDEAAEFEKVVVALIDEIAKNEKLPRDHVETFTRAYAKSSTLRTVMSMFNSVIMIHEEARKVIADSETRRKPDANAKR